MTGKSSDDLTKPALSESLKGRWTPLSQVESIFYLFQTLFSEKKIAYTIFVKIMEIF